MEWMNKENFSKYLDSTNLDTWTKNAIINKSMEEFFEKYPTPLDWLNSEKESMKMAYATSELAYILLWCYESNIWEKEEYRDTLIDYFISKKANQLFRNVALYLGLITNTEINKIKKITSRSVGLQKLFIICICLKTKFKNLTDEQFEFFYKFNNGNFLVPKRVQDIRIALGYSNKKSHARKFTKNWNALLNHEKFSEIFKEYRQTLQLGGANSRYIGVAGGAFVRLLNFMEYKGLEDFSTFEPTLFEELIQFMEDTKKNSAYSYISKIKSFFSYNEGQPLFPPKFEFCDLYWSAYTKLLKDLRSQSDGFAFSNLNFAKDIVSTLVKFEPSNEIEDLCKNFYLILASCPARKSYILNLDAYEAIKPLPNNPNAFGIYSRFLDKGGNKYGHFPLLDEQGVKAIEYLQERVKKLDLKPVYNSKNEESYVHLFQLTTKPWLLDENMIYTFFQDVVITKLTEKYPDDEEIRATAHGFRHFLITQVAIETGDEEVCRTAAGHHDVKMTREYMRSKSSKNALLLRVVDKYENHEITGKFYLRLVELLTSPDTDSSEILKAMSTEMKLDEFLNKYGQKLDRGYCFSNEECSNWNACWGCTNFIMTKNEITQAIIILSRQIVELKNFQLCADFSFDVPIVKNKFKLISLIIKRLTELGLTEEEIQKMVDNCLNDKEITTEVISNE